MRTPRSNTTYTQVVQILILNITLLLYTHLKLSRVMLGKDWREFLKNLEKTVIEMGFVGWCRVEVSVSRCVHEETVRCCSNIDHRTLRDVNLEVTQITQKLTLRRWWIPS